MMRKPKEKMLPRDGAFSFTLPSERGGTVKAMVTLGNHIEIYTPTETFKAQTPESIDPGRTNPNAMFVNAKIADVGCANPIVARTLITASRSLESGILLDAAKREQALGLMHKIKNTLLQCEAAHIDFKHIEDRQRKTFEATEQQSNARTLKNFPVMPDIDALATAFLIPARRAITDVCQIPNLFWPLTKRHSSLDYLLEKELEPRLGRDHHLVQWFDPWKQIIEHIIGLRNGQEHTTTTKGLPLVVKNFEMLPSNQVHAPVWHLEGEPPMPIALEMEQIVEHLTMFAEAMYLLCAEATLPAFAPLVLTEIEEPDPECPVGYEFVIDASRFPFQPVAAPGSAPPDKN